MVVFEIHVAAVLAAHNRFPKSAFFAIALNVFRLQTGFQPMFEAADRASILLPASPLRIPRTESRSGACGIPAAMLRLRLAFVLSVSRNGCTREVQALASSEDPFRRPSAPDTTGPSST